MPINTAHPILEVEQARAFVGKEVEGVVCLGLQTVILRDAVSESEWAALLLELPKHIFLTEQFEAWDWLEQVVLPWAKPRRIVVTAGRMAEQMDAFFALPTSTDVRVMVRFFDCKWHAMLRHKDEVSIGMPYSMTTIAIGLRHETVPADYLNDYKGGMA